MRRLKVEFWVGLFLMAGIFCLGYIAIRFGGLQVFATKGYTVQAIFPSVAGLKQGAVVEIAGVEIGRVKNIRLYNYQALVTIMLYSDVQLQEDAIATIRTKGLLGDKYVLITPGGSSRIIQAGGKIRETQPPVDLEQIISKYIFGQVGK